MHRFPLVRLLIASLLTLGSLTSSLLPTTAQIPPGSSPADPVAVGAMAPVGDYEVTVLNVMPDATEYVMAYSEYNSEPESGMQYFIARVRVTYTGATSGSPSSDLRMVTSTGGEDDESYSDWGYSCGDIPDSVSTWSNELFTGGTIEYNICWNIAAEDADSLVLSVSPGYSYNSSDVVWFSLGNAPQATPVPTSGLKPGTPAVVPSSRTEPIPVGTSSLVGTYTVQVVAVEPDATDQILTDQPYNDPPEEGNQFFRVTVSVTNQGDETSSVWWDLNFNTVGDQAIGYTEYTNSCGYVPNGIYDAPELAPGESAEFDVCWQVATDEAPSLVMYVDTGYDGEARTWFAIQP